MGRINQSISWWCFANRGVAAADLVKAVARMGYASCEMLPEEYWGMVRDAGMKVAIIGGHNSLTDGLNKRSNHNRIEDETLANLEVAVANDIPSLICFSGNREGLSDEEGLEICAEGLRRVAKTAEEKGVLLCVELLNSKVDHHDYQCDRTPWGVELCKAVGSPAVKLLYDIYHMQIMEGDLIRTIRDYIEYIGHFHTAGVPGRNDMDDTQEIYYPAVARAIADAGYQGYVGHEFIPKADVLAALQAAYTMFDV